MFSQYFVMSLEYGTSLLRQLVEGFLFLAVELIVCVVYKKKYIKPFKIFTNNEPSLSV